MGINLYNKWVLSVEYWNRISVSSFSFIYKKDRTFTISPKRYGLQHKYCSIYTYTVKKMFYNEGYRTFKKSIYKF